MTPWEKCRPLIQAALATSPGLESIEDVERLVDEGKYLVFFGKQSCAVAEIAQFALHKAFIIQHGGGDLTELLDVLEPKMCEFARSEGCTMMMGVGRKGWERVTEKRGYRFGYLTMYKDLLH